MCAEMSCLAELCSPLYTNRLDRFVFLFGLVVTASNSTKIVSTVIAASSCVCGLISVCKPTVLLLLMIELLLLPAPMIKIGDISDPDRFTV